MSLRTDIYAAKLRAELEPSRRTEDAVNIVVPHKLAKALTEALREEMVHHEESHPDDKHIDIEIPSPPDDLDRILEVVASRAAEKVKDPEEWGIITSIDDY